MIRWLRQRIGRLLAPVTVWRWRRREELAWALCAGQVRAGPFAGMQYVERAGGSALPPKLVGTYELELHGALDEARQRLQGRNGQCVIDLGAAEGYYAVGLARAWPEARVVAFEADGESRQLLAELAERNGVRDRIELHARADTDPLARTLTPGCLVICDIEGAEGTLLDPDALPVLRRCDLLVELHEFEAPGVGQALQERFVTTHKIERIVTRDRTADHWPASLGPVRPALMDELRRGPQAWWWMKAEPGAL